MMVWEVVLDEELPDEVLVSEVAVFDCDRSVEAKAVLWADNLLEEEAEGTEHELDIDGAACSGEQFGEKQVEFYDEVLASCAVLELERRQLVLQQLREMPFDPGGAGQLPRERLFRPRCCRRLC